MSDERNSVIEKVAFDIDGIRVDCIYTDANSFISSFCDKNGYERDMSVAATFDVRIQYDDTTISLRFSRFETDSEIVLRNKNEKASIEANKIRHEKELAKLEKLAAKLGKRVS